MNRIAKPTLEQFGKYQAAYDYFNARLFGSQLRPCLLVFRDGKRSKNGIVLGHFAPFRWANGAGARCHEISLNPACLTRTLAETFGTLVHEMAHQWQQDHGKPPRACYHDRQWAAKMVEVGLIPSDTGEPGGKQTGQRMTHYVDRTGRFQAALDSMPKAIALPWLTGEPLGPKDDPADPTEKQRNKIKYSCPCGVNLWGKPDLHVICGECEEAFAAA